MAEAGRVGRLAGRVGVTPDWSPVVARIREATAGCDGQLAVDPATPPIDGLDPDAPAVAVDANLRAGDGIRAVVQWPGRGEVPVTELVPDLLPVAARIATERRLPRLRLPRAGRLFARLARPRR